MTEKEIELLKFEKVYVSSQESGDKPFRYYVYKIVNGLELISNANTEIDNEDEWYVEFFDTFPAIRFSKFEDVQSLLNTIEKQIIK